MEDDFSIFHSGNFLSFHTKNLPFHSILKFSSIFHFILPYQRAFILGATQRITRTVVMLSVPSLVVTCESKQPTPKVRVTLQKCNDRYLVRIWFNDYKFAFT